MGNTFYFDWEVALMQFLQSHMGGAAVKIASVISALGEDLVLILIMGCAYWAVNKKAGLKIGVNIMTASLLFPLFKNVVLRRRPYMDHASIKCLKPVQKDADLMDIAAQGYSFPSGHSANSAVAMGSLAYFFRKKLFKILAVIVPLLVGISRFCLGVHYPTDVLCGWIIGCGVVFLIPALEKKFRNERTLYWIIFAAVTPGILFCRTNDYYTSFGMMLGLLLGNMFEEKYVNFKKAPNFISGALRVAGGVAIYFGLNTVLKMPFPAELLQSATMAQFAIRAARYALIIFIEVGIYPMIFGKIIKAPED